MDYQLLFSRFAAQPAHTRWSRQRSCMSVCAMPFAAARSARGPGCRITDCP